MGNNTGKNKSKDKVKEPTVESNDEKTNDIDENQLVTFSLDNIEFGVPINKVKEIVRVPERTKIPNSPDFIEGIANLRGTVLPIINSRIRLGMKTADFDEQTRILVIDINGISTGMIVDSVKEVLRIQNDLIEPPPSVVKGVNSDYLQGVIKLDNGKRLILTIDLLKTCFVNLKKADLQKSQKSSSSNYDRSKEVLDAMVDEELVVTFLIDKEEFAFSINAVSEIIRVPDITSVPNSPAFVKGVISLRDQILPIVDFRLYLSLDLIEYSDSTRIIVIEIGEAKIGLIVDKVLEVLRIPKDVIDPPPAIFSNQEQERLQGLAKINQGKRLIMIFDSENLFDKGEIKEMGTLAKNKNKTSSDVQSTKELIEEEHLVTFKLDEEEFGVQIIQVQEINRLQDITKVPNSPDFIEGVANLRGNVVPVISLRKRFALEEREYDDKTRLIIVEVEGSKTGLVVDSVSEVLRISKKNIELTPAVISSSVNNEFIESIGKLDKGNRMIILLNLNKLLSDEEAKQLKKISKTN